MGGLISWGDHKTGGYKRGYWWVLKKFVDMNENSVILHSERGDKVGVHATYNKDNGNLKILLGTKYEDDTKDFGLVRVSFNDFDISGQPHYEVYKFERKFTISYNDKGEKERHPGNGKVDHEPILVEDKDLSTPYIDVDWGEADNSYYIEVSSIPAFLGPMGIEIEGPTEVAVTDSTHVWTAEVYGGVPPYQQYLWEINIKLYNQPGWSGWHSMGNDKTLSGFAPFYSGLDVKLRVTVTDANNDTDTSGIFEVSIY